MGAMRAKTLFIADDDDDDDDDFIRVRRASQGPQGRVAPSGGARQGPIVGYVLRSAAPTGPPSP